MNRQEPYIGMPIHFDDFDDMSVTCCGQTDAEMAAPARKTESEKKPAQNMQPMALAMAYVPWQRWTETYPLDEGLQKGTIFPDLYLPFEGRRKGGKRR